MEDSEIHEQRENFAIQSEIIIKNMQKMIDETKKMENILLQEIVNRVSSTEFYVPITNRDIEPPRKRKKM